MNDDAAENSHWTGMSARYAAFTPPLRLSAVECDHFIELASQWSANSHAGHDAPRVLVLGATPDFHGFPWPRGTDLLAVDHSAEMLAAVWPGSSEQSLCADWVTMKLPDASRDLVLCDGGFTFIPSPEPLQQLADNVARILAPGGRLITRLYVNADEQETPAQLFHDLEQGRVQTVSELKLRLWLALNATPNGAQRTGVRLVDVWRCFQAEFTTPEQVARRVSQPDSVWQALQAYEGKTDSYYFPSAEEVSQAFMRSTVGLEIDAVIQPQVHCGQHLCLLSLRRPG